MSKYLLIQSKSPWESAEVPQFYNLARDLAAAGNEVTLFLVQNGVMPARKGAKDGALTELTNKVSVVADDFSLKERAIALDAIVAGVKSASIDLLVDLLASGAKAIWH